MTIMEQPAKPDETHPTEPSREELRQELVKIHPSLEALLDPNREPFPLETDPNRVISWNEAATGEHVDVVNYWRQRIHPAATGFPRVFVSVAVFRNLITGPYDILGRMMVEDPEASMEFATVYDPLKRGRVLILFWLEEPNAGQRAVEYLRKNQKTLDHERFLRVMDTAAANMQPWYQRWLDESAEVARTTPHKLIAGRRYFKMAIGQGLPDAEAYARPY